MDKYRIREWADDQGSFFEVEERWFSKVWISLRTFDTEPEALNYVRSRRIKKPFLVKTTYLNEKGFEDLSFR